MVGCLRASLIPTGRTYNKGGHSSIRIRTIIAIALHGGGQWRHLVTFVGHNTGSNCQSVNLLSQHIGTVFYARKSYRRAIEQYKKALRYTPESASVLSNLGTAYFARKNYEEALKYYDQALALDPGVFEHRGTQGTVLQERSVEERAKFHYFLAKSYAKAGDKPHALQYVRMALEEGFKEREKLTKDPEFAPYLQDEEFQNLLKMELKAL